MTQYFSLKYKILKRTAKLTGSRKKQSGSAEELIEKYRKKPKVLNIPQKANSPFLTFEIKNENLYVFSYLRHKSRLCKVLMYIPGGGMLQYPVASDYKLFEELTLETNRDVVIPYYPLCIDGTIDVSLDMIYWLYKRLISEYGEGNVAVAGCSSGGNLALGLISHINAKGENLPMPEKLYVSSPVMCIYTQEERERAEQLDKTDIAVPVKWLDTEYDIITHGKELPPYMAYPQLGIYDGLKEAYISFADNEVLYAMCDSLVSRMEAAGVDVQLEIGWGLYHCYPVKNVVRDAFWGHVNMLKYLKADILSSLSINNSKSQ